MIFFRLIYPGYSKFKTPVIMQLIHSKPDFKYQLYIYMYIYITYIIKIRYLIHDVPCISLMFIWYYQYCWYNAPYITNFSIISSKAFGLMFRVHDEIHISSLLFFWPFLIFLLHHFSIDLMLPSLNSLSTNSS